MSGTFKAILHTPGKPCHAWNVGFNGCFGCGQPYKEVTQDEYDAWQIKYQKYLDKINKY